MPPPTTIRFGHSPDPDDAFMYFSLGRKLVDTGGFEFVQVLEDIESLNKRAMRAELETTAASVHACAHLSDRYAILPCGASMGDGYGPIVVAARPMTLERLRSVTVAVPGLMTSAYLALRLAIGEFRHVLVPFDKVAQAVTSGEADAGLLIHEGQITWEREGLHRVIDLGIWWRERTRGLPLPLGVNIVRKDLGEETMRGVGMALRRAIDYSLDNRGAALAYAGDFARGLESALTDQFVSMYVNDLTREMGGRGREAIRLFLEEGRLIGVIGTDACRDAPEFVTLEKGTV